MTSPACHSGGAPNSISVNPPSLDGFQRRKVGSIRNNPKLSKIRQQFEGGDIENTTNSGSFKDPAKLAKDLFPSKSAPCSLNFSYSSIKKGIESLMAVGSPEKTKEASFALRSCDKSDYLRRHSEGDAGSSNRQVPLTCFSANFAALRDSEKFWRKPANSTHVPLTSNERSSICKFNDQSKLLSEKTRTIDASTLSVSPPSYRQRNRQRPAEPNGHVVVDRTSGVPCSPSDASGLAKRTDSSSSELADCIKKATACGKSTIQKPEHSENKSGDLSLLLTDTRVSSGNNNISEKESTRNSVKCVSSPTSKPPTSTKGVIKKDSVRNAIRIYEGMSSSEISSSSSELETKCPKTVHQNEPVIANSDGEKKPGIPRRSSRRNSIRRSKACTKKEHSSKKEICDPEIMFHHVKEDSGVGLSDTEDLNKESSSQPIYQTLCGTKRSFDPYDRLNRIHDMVNRIHKGQSSTCAACKAVPSTVFPFPPSAGNSFLHVRCNEVLPHHHPPCVCFLCQHSIFSCVQGTDASSEVSLESLKISDSPDSLYYNVCCLSAPTPDSWRLSRRKPVCEQNGRLCVVNCDVERSSIELDEFYEKLSEWHSNPSKVFTVKGQSRTVSKMKQVTGDSCDSDEGWVDITDSEEEKSFSVCTENKHETCVNQIGTTVENAAYDVHQKDDVHYKTDHGDISRSSSSEHLYETIADVDSQNCVQDPTKNTEGYLHQKDITPLHKNSSIDNDHDSGEWSTGSSSPILNESLNFSGVSESTSIISDPFSIPLTNFLSEPDQEGSNPKKTFIKSVLSKKTVTSKKRRMSNFFVPWLVSNQEYGSTSTRSPKAGVKKHSIRGVRVDNNLLKPKRTFTKSKRSQSIPTSNCSAYVSSDQLYHTTLKASEKQDQGDSVFMEDIDEKFLKNTFALNMDKIHDISQRGSLASSTYLRPDQLHCGPVVRPQPCTPSDMPAVEVWMQKVTKRSLSGESDHSYILFQPIKEEDVPLYQFYERNIKERVALCRTPDSLSPIMWSTIVDNNCSHDCGQKTHALKPQLSVIEQLSPDTKDNKMLWCELPEVKDSGILGRISAQELKLQEAAFEFIQSQASYIRSLKVLYEYFISSTEFSDTQSAHCVLSKHEHDVLFSDIVRVKEVSESLMAELTNRWSEGILIPDICDILYKHTTVASFSIYIKYCSNRVYQERTLKELKETRLCFLEVLRRLESNPACQGLSLESFLFLPMQHIARLPLLLDSIFRWLTPESPSYSICRMTLEVVQKIFIDCNEGAKKMERLEEMLILNKQLEFRDCKAIPLISTSRWLLKKGELTKLEFDKKTFGRSSRCVRNPMYIFLFNDLIVITKRKSEDSYFVMDYCLREKIQVTAVDAKDLPQPLLVPSTCHYLIYLTLFSNHQGNNVDMILNCTLLSERIRWIEAIHPASQNKSNEVWDYDCPQVQCVRTYIAQQPDELSLQESDVVTIYRKMNDGWYEGRRLRDGLQGWFPASYTMDIPCSRARASNLRQCYRLLMLSQKHTK